jgi:hypothetical protein
MVAMVKRLIHKTRNTAYNYSLNNEIPTIAPHKVSLPADNTVQLHSAWSRQ